LAEYLDLNRLVAPPRVNDDFLDDLADGVACRRAIVLISLSQRSFEVPHLVAIGIGRVRMELDRRRGNIGNRRLNLVAFSLKGS
jgi:hypothetical protein